ncbi:WD repeat-containing and planar cell polarity effector protein Fritz, partial [Trinorchestia longiramus]
MATLSGDVKVWSLREDVVVRDADFAAVRYQDKSNVSKERVYYEEKKHYIESRGGCVAPKNSRPTRLRDALKEFEELLSSEHVVWSSWGLHCSLPLPTESVSDSISQRAEPCRVYYLVLSSGMVCTALVSAVTGDLRALSSDKYMVGKLLSEHPAHAVITESHLVISYNDSRLSVLHLDPYTPPSVLPLPHPPAGGSCTPSLASRHPSLYTTQLVGPHGRRFHRKLTANITGQMIAVWWERSEDEVYPWSPLERDCRDRANILIYSVRCGQLSLVGHARSHLPPLSVAFSARDANVVLSVEQGFDKKGGVTVLSVVYKKSKARVERVSVTSIPLEAPVASHSYSPQEDRLFLACNNGVLALHSHASTHLTRAALSPTHVTWLQPGALLAVANDRGQVQFFDMALSLVRVQLGGEDGIPVRLLDFADYFCHQPSLRHISWAPAPVVFSCSDSKRSANANVKRYLDVCEQHSSMLLMLHYARGPLVCLRFNAPHFSLTHPVSNPRCDDLGLSSISPREDSDPLNTSHVSYASTVSNSSNSSTTKSSTNVHNESLNVTETSDGCLAARENRALTSHYCSISPDVLVGEYLCHGQVEEAINLSRSLCWEQDGGAALKCISNVVNYIIRRGQLSRHISGGGDLTDKLEDPSLEDKEPGSSTGIAALGLWESRILSAASALSSGFLSPSTALTAATEELYGPPVRALARRLFFKLLRSGCVQPAYSLARDLGDPDCFVRLHRAALRAGLPQLAAASLQRAHSLRSSSSSSSSSCSCSDSDWSGSSSSSCCSDDCSHSSYSSSRSCSDTCSTCSDTSDGTDSDDLPEGRGERQGGDGRESEG